MSTPTIGILAGMGPHSTAPFLDLVLAECQAQYGARNDIDFPPIQVLSWPVPFYADRPVDEREVEEATRPRPAAPRGVRGELHRDRLQHRPHLLPRLERSVGVPLLDMVALAADAAPEKPSRIALIAARSTAESGIYQRALEARGQLCSPRTGRRRWTCSSTRLRLTERDRRIRDLWDILAQQAKDVRAEGLVLACADLTAVSGSLATLCRCSTRPGCWRGGSSADGWRRGRMENPEPVTLEGHGVRLEPLTADHADHLATAAADGRLWELLVHLGAVAGGDRGYVATALEGQQEGHMLPWAVRDLGSGTIVGSTRYHDIVPGVDRVEIGYTWYSASRQRSH